MVKRSHRMLYAMVALVGGIGLVMVLVFLGSKSRGPLANLLDKAGSIVSSAENEFILQNRTDRRINRLRWLSPSSLNPLLLKNQSRILLGAYDNKTTTSYNSLIDLEDSLRTTFPLIHLYTAWGDKPEEEFPRLQVQAISELGSVPVITWEPWLTDFNAAKNPGLPPPDKREKGGLRDVAKGKYDFYITQWAAGAKNYGKVLLIRLGHEMNDPYRYPWGPQNNTAKEYVAAWKHVHMIFEAAGAGNVLWIWSPHPSYGWFDAFYPGDRYVDYIGVNVLNYGNAVSWSKWWSFREIFGTHYKELAKFNKPIMITEFASLAVGGNRPGWFREALHDLPREYPEIKAILFFHFSDDKTTTQKAVDWTIKEDTATLHAIVGEIRSWPELFRPPMH